VITLSDAYVYDVRLDLQLAYVGNGVGVLLNQKFHILHTLCNFMSSPRARLRITGQDPLKLRNLGQVRFGKERLGKVRLGCEGPMLTKTT
jgi:hypothetical protein